MKKTISLGRKRIAILFWGGGAGVEAVLQMLLCLKEGEKEPPTDAQWLADKVRAVA